MADNDYGHGPYDSPAANSKESWDAYWKAMRVEADKLGPLGRLNYWIVKTIDFPATYFRENIVIPLREKYGQRPYYHMEFKRGPSIDECAVDDFACIQQANLQYRLDKQIDAKIVSILKERQLRCYDYWGAENRHKCIEAHEAFEEADLNFFIKYGELRSKDAAIAAYMKQKHRMIFERRNPQIMKERTEAIAEHKRQIAEGHHNPYFWRTLGSSWVNRSQHPYAWMRRQWVKGGSGQEWTSEWPDFKSGSKAPPFTIPQTYPPVEPYPGLEDQFQY